MIHDTSKIINCCDFATVALQQWTGTFTQNHKMDFIRSQIKSDYGTGSEKQRSAYGITLMAGGLNNPAPLSRIFVHPFWQQSSAKAQPMDTCWTCHIIGVWIRIEPFQGSFCVIWTVVLMHLNEPSGLADWAYSNQITLALVNATKLKSSNAAGLAIFSFDPNHRFIVTITSHGVKAIRNSFSRLNWVSPDTHAGDMTKECLTWILSCLEY